MKRICFGTALAIAGLMAAPLAAQTQVDAPNTGPFDGVFVEQIGDDNSATFSQSNAAQNAEVVQDGNDNTVQVAQFGDGDHFAGVDQTGDDNLAFCSRRMTTGSRALALRSPKAVWAILRPSFRMAMTTKRS